jgi:DNA-binding MarR family transcriptional regulator
MTKIHYRLTNDEWLALVARLKLNFAEVKVLMHLRTIDPFGDKFKDADTKDIAANLEIHQRTVQKALYTLAAKELIDLEIGKFRFRLRSQIAASTPPDDPQAA